MFYLILLSTVLCATFSLYAGKIIFLIAHLLMVASLFYYKTAR